MTTSKRMGILNAMVTTLAAIDGTGVFNNDLSGTEQVTLNANADGDAWKGYKRFVWVHEGEETADVDTPLAVSPLTEDVALIVLVDATIRDATADTLVQECNDLLHDIRYQIANNISLGGECYTAQIFSVDQPAYDSSEKIALLRVRVRVRYAYDASAV